MKNSFAVKRYNWPLWSLNIAQIESILAKVKCISLRILRCICFPVVWNDENTFERKLSVNWDNVHHHTTQLWKLSDDMKLGFNLLKFLMLRKQGLCYLWIKLTQKEEDNADWIAMVNKWWCLLRLKRMMLMDMHMMKIMILRSW